MPGKPSSQIPFLKVRFHYTTLARPLEWAGLTLSHSDLSRQVIHGPDEGPDILDDSGRRLYLVDPDLAAAEQRKAEVVDQPAVIGPLQVHMDNDALPQRGLVIRKPKLDSALLIYRHRADPVVDSVGRGRQGKPGNGVGDKGCDLSELV